MSSDLRWRLKQSVRVVPWRGKIAFSYTGRSVQVPDTSEWADAARLLLRGTTGSSLAQVFVVDSKDRAQGLIEALTKLGAFEAPVHAGGIPQSFLERHERTLRWLGQFERTDRDRFDFLAALRQARVLLLGLGGAGSWIAYQLLLTGLGHLRACDGDTVERSNLNRTALLSEAHVGRTKCDALTEQFQILFPDSTLDLRHARITSAHDVAERAEGCDLIIGVADTPMRTIRLWVSQASMDTGIPSLQAGGGFVGPFFVPGRSSCAGCLQATQLAALHLEGVDAEIALAGVDRFPRQAPAAPVMQPAAFSSAVVLEAVLHLSRAAQPATLNRAMKMGSTLIDGQLLDVLPQRDCVIACGSKLPKEEVILS